MIHTGFRLADFAGIGNDEDAVLVSVKMIHDSCVKLVYRVPHPRRPGCYRRRILIINTIHVVNKENQNEFLAKLRECERRREFYRQRIMEMYQRERLACIRIQKASYETRNQASKATRRVEHGVEMTEGMDLENIPAPTALDHLKTFFSNLHFF